jgi:hypothetical protein
VHALGAVIGALVLIVVGCTPPPGPAAVDRINSWTVDGTPIHTNLMIERGTPPPHGFVENTSTTSTVELTTEVGFRLGTSTVSVSCVGPQVPVGAGLSCPAQGTSVAEFQNPAETYAGVLSGTLTTSGPAGSITAVFEGLVSGLPYGIPDSDVVYSLYDGAPAQP